MKKADVVQFYARLAEANPHPETELESANVYQLLVAVVLSAQATDAGVNKATRALFAAVATPAQMVAIGLDALKQHIRTIGLFNTKAKNVIALSEALIRDHAGAVPADRDALGGAARGRAQDRERRDEHRVRRGNLRGGHAHLPRRQPHGPGPGQDPACGGEGAGPGDPRAVPAPRASLADPARALCLQGAHPRMLALHRRRSVRVQTQDAAPAREAHAPARED